MTNIEECIDKLEKMDKELKDDLSQHLNAYSGESRMKNFELRVEIYRLILQQFKG